MTLGAKEFGRYLLPVFPIVDLLAAVGWAELLRRWLPAARARWLPSLLTLGLAIAQFVVLWPTRPNYFPYHNPLLGGARTAQRMLLVGWGEGLEGAAVHLNPFLHEVNVSELRRITPAVLLVALALYGLVRNRRGLLVLGLLPALLFEESVAVVVVTVAFYLLLKREWELGGGLFSWVASGSSWSLP